MNEEELLEANIKLIEHNRRMEFLFDMISHLDRAKSDLNRSKESLKKADGYIDDEVENEFKKIVGSIEKLKEIIYEYHKEKVEGKTKS